MGQAGQRESVPRRGRGSRRVGPGRQRRGARAQRRGHWQVGRRIRRVRLAGCAGSWAAGRRAGPAGERERGEEVDRAGLGRGRGVGRGKAWADLGCWDGLVGLVFFLGFAILFLLLF